MAGLLYVQIKTKQPNRMKKIFLSILIFVIFYLPMQAQISSPVGEYYLTGVMETASGFKLNEDSTFQFFFSYGALDRYGSGTWKMNNNIITLNSKPYPGHDFKMTASENTKDNFTTVRIDESNRN